MYQEPAGRDDAKTGKFTGKAIKGIKPLQPKSKKSPFAVGKNYDTSMEGGTGLKSPKSFTPKFPKFNAKATSKNSFGKKAL